jgi:hypothetical protein
MAGLHFGRFWAILKDFGRFWAILGDFGRFWAILGDLGDFFHVCLLLPIRDRVTRRVCEKIAKHGLGYILGDFFHKLIWDRCSDFKNIFAKIFCENIGIFCSNYC